jgi:hypothetical protein
MIYLKLYEDYEQSLFEELTSSDHRDIPRESFIEFSNYPLKKNLINFIKSKLGNIFAHNDFLTHLEKSYHLDLRYDIFHILERKNLPFTISLKITDEDWFIVKLTYYTQYATYLYWKCDGLKGFIAFLNHLISQPKKYVDWIGKHLLRNPFSVELGTQFTYTDEQLKKIIDKLDIKEEVTLNNTFDIKLDRKSAKPGNAYSTWELVIGDMLYWDISYIPSINCFGVESEILNLFGKKGVKNSYTCFTEVGLYYLLEKEYEIMKGIYNV